VTSPVFVTRAADGSVSAACGYRIWRDTLAHMCVLTHPDHRGRGLATMVGSAATAYALDAGLVPQWRARVPASIAVAAALGYTMLGAQLSFRLPDPLAP
jgi:GNAT superfamily N-acetyltransferase